MSRAADLLAVNCTACGAGLDVLGGGRVIVHVCPYCGTALDAVEGYRALRKFNETPRPDTMLEIGQSGEIFGVRYTVIGLLQLEERWGGRTWQWIDYQIFSPTHGYAWLTDQRLGFTRTPLRPFAAGDQTVVRFKERTLTVEAVEVSDATLQWEVVDVKTADPAEAQTAGLV